MSGSVAAERKPHAVLDAPSRRLKALKIERLLELRPQSRPLRMLEVGCGIGGISHYFGTHPDLRCEVDAVDLHDLRQVTEGYRFTRVSDTRLPFAAGEFDVVISNHVIEHVGDRARQADHLAEVHRVMKPQGRGYLAVPNRWQLIEPHYQLAFLSWLPRPWRTPYLRRMRGAEFYDCEPLTAGELERLLRQAQFSFENVCARATRLTFAIERPGSAADALLEVVPESWLHALRRVIPTLIYLLHPAGADGR
ncbi:MAG: class I SAM-dependent methyltransferase [Nevskia sp.]|nr:class I SAM-dependent methyltransferase [Nevskia sp.]